MTLRRLALVLCLAAAGCSPSVEEWCHSYFEALSVHDVYCGVPPDVAQATWKPQEDADCPAYTKRLRARMIDYDAAQGEKCLAQIRSRGCLPSPSIGGTDPCALAIAGTVAVGGGCYVGRDCLAGATCAYKNDACPGTCAQYPVLGEACWSECSPGASCAAGVCAAPAREGESCGLPEHPLCGEALWCGALTLHCRAIGAITGGRCEGEQDCALGFVCVGATPSQAITGACVKARPTSAACTAGECEIYDFCSQGVCAPLPRPGEWCGDGAACAIGRCVSGICQALAKAGAGCDVNEACETGFCDRPSAKCAWYCAPP